MVGRIGGAVGGQFLVARGHLMGRLEVRVPQFKESVSATAVRIPG